MALLIFSSLVLLTSGSKNCNSWAWIALLIRFVGQGFSIRSKGEWVICVLLGKDWISALGLNCKRTFCLLGLGSVLKEYCELLIEIGWKIKVFEFKDWFVIIFDGD